MRALKHKGTPLDSIERYLWLRLKRFPHWLAPHPPKTALHVYYEEGWELVNHLKMLLFTSSSSLGNKWPFAIEGCPSERRLFEIRCQHVGCDDWSECILNDVKNGPEEDDWERLPDAPRFYCFPHCEEVRTGTKYIPPTREESLMMEAQGRAIVRMIKEKPPTSLKLDCGLTVDSHIVMDERYLRRLAELTQEEYKTLSRLT